MILMYGCFSSSLSRYLDISVFTVYIVILFFSESLKVFDFQKISTRGKSTSHKTQNPTFVQLYSRPSFKSGAFRLRLGANSSSNILLIPAMPLKN